jgi:hypothetical protein
MERISCYGRKERPMEWDVLFDDDFTIWFNDQSEALQDEILAQVLLLRERPAAWQSSC